MYPSESESFRVVSGALRIYVEVDGTAMEVQTIPASIHLASIPKPGAKDFVRMIVHGVSGRSGEERPPILELAKRLEQRRNISRVAEIERRWMLTPR